jgi:hypothetical protein
MVTREQMVKAADAVAAQIEMGLRPGRGRMFVMVDEYTDTEETHMKPFPNGPWVPCCTMGHLKVALGQPDFHLPIGWMEVASKNDNGNWDEVPEALRHYARTCDLSKDYSEEEEDEG